MPHGSGRPRDPLKATSAHSAGLLAAVDVHDGRALGVHSFSDTAAVVARRMGVGHGRIHRRVTHAPLEISQSGAVGGGEELPQVAQVVDADALVAHGAQGPRDRDLDAVVRASPRAGGEDQAVGADGGVVPHVLPERFGDELRQHDGAHAGPGLRRLDLVLAVDGVDGALDPDLGVLEVDVLASQLGRLAQADPGPGEQVDGGPVAIGHLAGQLLDLVNAQGWSFGVPVRAGALDPAGVVRDELVLDSGVHDRLEQAVGVRQSRGAHLVWGGERRLLHGDDPQVLAELGVPLADDGGRHVADHQGADAGLDVQVPHRAVALARRCLDRPLGDPGAPVLAQRDPCVLWGLPRLAHDVGLDGREVGVGIGLRGERAGSRALQSVATDVARLIAPGRQLSDVAERPLTRLLRGHRIPLG